MENCFLIWDKEKQQNRWMCFRKTFTLLEVPEHVTVAIAVDSKYWLYINEKMVVFDGGINRESLPGCGYFDEIDITSYIREGNNIMALLVLYWGNEGRNNVDSKQGGLILSCPKLNIFSDESFRMIVHPAYTKTEEPYPSYLYGGHNVGYDARKDIGNWMELDYDDIQWDKPSIINKDVWGTLIKRPIPQMRFSNLMQYTKVIMQGDKIEAYLPYACHLTPYFKIISKAGVKIDIRTDRYEVNGGPGEEFKTYKSHRVEYITKEGIQEFESFDWLFGEKVIYSFPSGVEIIDLRYRESGYGASFIGNFVCENIILNRLIEKCKRTLYVCMRDNYMDCPDRERGQWIGDVSSQVPQTFYCLDRRADLLTKKAISDFILLRKGDVLVGNVPGVNFCELPSQSLNAISEIGMIMTYYNYSGDKDVIYLSFEAVKKYLLLWEMAPDGLIEKRKGSWYWFDHLDNVDERVLENCWYYSALSSAFKMAQITGNFENMEIFEKRRESIKNNFNRAFKKYDGYRSGALCDDRANAMAVLSGLASNDIIDKIIEVFENTFFSTPYMEYYVLEAMIKVGAGRTALKRILKRYGSLIENENTTLWEDFNLLGTRNHAWSGGPLTILFKHAAGIMPQKPGFEEVAIMPVNMGLKEINAHVETVYGLVEVNIFSGDINYDLKVILPEGVHGKVGIPFDCFSDGQIGEIKHNGKIEQGKIYNNKYIFDISGKEHKFEVFLKQ